MSILYPYYSAALAFFGYAHWSEGAGIALAVFLATFVATYSEFKNEESFRELQEEASRAKNNVFRDGKVQNLVVTEIVVGDFVLLQAGDKVFLAPSSLFFSFLSFLTPFLSPSSHCFQVPADGPMIDGFLHSNQASLTGEPEPIRKTPNPKQKNGKDELTNPHYVFRGSLIEDGEGVMVVESIGSETVYGNLMAEMNDEVRCSSPTSLSLSPLAILLSSRSLHSL